MPHLNKMKTFILRNTTTGAFFARSRQDGLPTKGLDADIVEYEVLQQDMPTDVDASTHYVEAAAEVIDEDARTVTRGWIVKELPPPQPIPVAGTVDKTALFLELSSRGLYSTLEAIINGIPDPQVKEEALIWMRYAKTVDRHHSIVVGLAQQLNLDTTTMDEIFTAAKVREDTMAQATLNLTPSGP